MSWNSQSVVDRELQRTKALPNGAATTTTDSIDLIGGANGQHLTDVEFELVVPAVTTAMVGDGTTIKYDVIASASSDMSSPSVVYAALVTQTGAGGAGAAGSTTRFRLPSNVGRYVGVRAVKSATGNASTVNMVLTPQF